MLIRPRLNDHHGIFVPQANLDFAIPFLDEDIPLYVDPFLLWKSPSIQDKALHQLIVGAFNSFGKMFLAGSEDQAIENVIAASECGEVGLGNSATRVGRRMDRKTAESALMLFRRFPQYRDHGISHIEELQLLVDGISRDRISDFACTFIKSFLVDFTIDQCDQLGLPRTKVDIHHVYNVSSGSLESESCELPTNPSNGSPILFVPKRWLRHVPWINYDTYFKDYCPQDDISHEGEKLDRVKVLNYNRDNYGVVESYVKARQRTASDCYSDPLFTQLPVISAKRKLATLRKLPTGKADNADMKYEALIGDLLPTMLYPQLDFAKAQARTDSGVSIRDLIFYNPRTHAFLEEIYADYGSRQIVMEMKNVANLTIAHIDQLNRYMAAELGQFGVLITRHPLPDSIFKRTIDLWSGQRKALIALTDDDIALMVQLFDQKQRDPLDVVIKKYAEFRRECP